VALVRERTIPTERPPPVGEVSANFCGVEYIQLGILSCFFLKVGRSSLLTSFKVAGFVVLFPVVKSMRLDIGSYRL
jgi:hypothetical protein